MAVLGRGLWRVLAVPVVAVSLLVSTVAVAPSAGADAGFGDVEAAAFYTRAVQWMVDNGITKGVTEECFEPYTPIDRGQAAVFMWRMEGEQAPSAPHGFGDVPAWMSTAVAWMVEQGVTLGTTATTFSPGQILTRAELVTFLWRLAGSPAPSSGAHSFTDIVPGAFYYAAVLWAVEQRITKGTTTATFSPGDTVTRGQVATFFHRYKGEPAVVVDPASPLCRGRDDFNGRLQAGWSWVDGDPFARSLTDVPGFLAMRGAAGSGNEELVRDRVADNYEIETKVTFSPFANFQAAGLTIRQDGDDLVSIARGYCDAPLCGGHAIYFDNTVGGTFDFDFVSLPAATGDVYLRLRHEAGTYTGWYSLDGSTWTEVASRSRALVDPQVGIFTGRSVSAPVPVAYFDWFAERLL